MLVEKIINTNFESRIVKRNFFLNVFDGAVFALAMALAAQNTVIPVFIKSIGGGSIAIALIPVIWTIGFNFPQIFIANFAVKAKYKKPILLKTGIFQRIFWLVLFLASYFVIPKVSAAIGVIVFFMAFMLCALGGGVNLPGWFGLISKVTPVNIRGRLFALRVAIGAVFGAIGGYVVVFILDNISYPENYSILFFITFIFTMVSYSFQFFLIEEEPSASPATLNYRQYLKYIPEVLKQNKNFRNFLIGDSIMIVAYTSFAFYTVDAIEKYSLPDSSAGEFTMITMVGMIIGSVLFGYLGDNNGHKTNIIFTSLFTLLAAVVAVISSNVFVYYIVFILVAFVQSLIQVSRLSIIAEMCEDKDRPIYVALTNIVTVPFLLTGIVAGWLADLFGYNIVFLICAFIAGFAMLWFVKMVEEPRKKLILSTITNN
jgi:MFS family permease